MRVMNLEVGQRGNRQDLPAPNRKKSAPQAHSCRPIVSLGELYAHALAIEYEAEARYRELAGFMADYGNDSAAGLFLHLAENEARYALHLVEKSVGIEIPVIDGGEYAWLDRGAPLSEARAFVFRMMTPRLGLETALRAQEQARAFFERASAESRNADIRKLAAAFKLDQESRLARVKEALAQLPQPPGSREGSTG